MFSFHNLTFIIIILKSMTQLNIFEKKKTVKNEILYNVSTSLMD